MRNRHYFLLDLIGLAVVPLAAMLIRFEGFGWDPGQASTVVWFSALSLVAGLAVLWRMGIYQYMWRYASVIELERILLAGTIMAGIDLILGLGVGPLRGGPRMPFSVLILDALLTVGVLAFPRLAARMLYVRRPRRGTVERVLVVGAGAAGQLVAREAALADRLHLEIVAFVDDDPRKQGQLLNGIPVVGRVNEIPRLIRTLGVAEVVIAMPSARGAEIRRVVELAAEGGARTRTVPSFADLVSGRVEVSALRPVEIADLLRRAPIATDITKVSSLAKGRTVLVTGAGGSIGSELCRQIAALEPELLVLLDHSENLIFEISDELRRRFPSRAIQSVIADVRDEGRVRDTFERFRPFAVFHAAAHKHVPLMEENVIEAVTNNVLGTRRLVDAAVEFGTEHFVLISTDKAVRPTSVMGATKRLAEVIVRTAATLHERHFVVVRFGNVLGSRGSVVPTFMAQIERGGPVTVTHPEMRRYFMTIPEAVQLVLQAGALGKGGELFVLDMGEMVKIADLARDLIRLSGLEEGTDIEIRYTGMRPGEKLYEDLLFGDEDVRSTEHPKVIRVLADDRDVDLRGRIDELLRGVAMRQLDEEALRDAITSLVPDFLSAERSPDILPLVKRPSGEGRLIS
jgi:FlaA1/EpsC-like NDP-sugar epimerase